MKTISNERQKEIKQDLSRGRGIILYSILFLTAIGLGIALLFFS
jgi:hypothetical protein